MKNLNIILSISLFISACKSSNELINSRDNGINFLQSQEYKFDYLYLYKYLEDRNENLKPLYNHSETLFYLDSISKSNYSDDQEAYILMKQFFRLVDSSYVIDDTTFNQRVKLNAITLPALYCDQRVMDTSSYFPFLREKCFGNDYEITHVLLSIIWLEERKCFDRRDLKNIKQLAIDNTTAILKRNNGTWGDINIEALALLQAAGCKISKKQIKEVLLFQQEDGGWKRKPDYPVSSTHTTTLAIWLIHEYLEN